MEFIPPSLDSASVTYGIVSLVIVFLACAVVDLISAASRWLYEKALEMRKSRIGDEPCLIYRLWRKFFRKDDAA